MAQLGRRVIKAIEELEAITIARVHGHAAGVGFLMSCLREVPHGPKLGQESPLKPEETIRRGGGVV